MLLLLKNRDPVVTQPQVLAEGEWKFRDSPGNPNVRSLRSGPAMLPYKPGVRRG